jgi:hypothetical protein
MAPPQGGAIAFGHKLVDRADSLRGSSPSVTAVTTRDAFGVDLTLVETYSQAQGDV